jgi:protein phosphatase
VVIGITAGACTDVGALRTVNEDRVYAGARLWAVADGMGGHAAGEVASEIVISYLARLDVPDLQQQAIVHALMEANAAVLAHGRDVPESAGLGSTVTGVAEVILGGSPHWAVFNVGDSRVYREYGDQFARATLDHSEVEELIMQGLLTEEEARHHASRSVITRSIGTQPAPQVDVWMLPQTPGERFVICSDGLTSELTDAAIHSIIHGGGLPDALAARLVAAAVDAGGRDNVSVVVVQVESVGQIEAETEATNPRSALHEQGAS